MDKVLVKNAASSKQVSKASKKEQLQRDQELEDIKYVMSHPSGQRFVWRLLEHCKTFNSIWHSSALVHYNAGKQDVGHFLMAEITSADRKLLFNLMQERLNNNEGE